MLGRFTTWYPSGGSTAEAAVQEAKAMLASTVGDLGIRTDRSAAYFQIDGLRIRLTPAYLDDVGISPSGEITLPMGRGYWVPDAKTWKMVDPEGDAQAIARANSEAEGRLLPAIKLLKAAHRHGFPEMHSFHLEVLAAHIVPEVVRMSIARRMPLPMSLLMHLFFRGAQSRVLQKAELPDSKTAPADLGLPAERRASLSQKFARLAQMTEESFVLGHSDAADVWRGVFGDLFPA